MYLACLQVINLWQMVGYEIASGNRKEKSDTEFGDEWFPVNVDDFKFYLSQKPEQTKSDVANRILCKLQDKYDEKKYNLIVSGYIKYIEIQIKIYKWLVGLENERKSQAFTVDAELVNDWFIFPAGTPICIISDWFTNQSKFFKYWEVYNI